jgi:phosphoglucosamine mutase
VVPVGVYPDGFNINQRCGATDPGRMQEAVVTHNADFGIALDGDADRAILADEKGNVIDGDQVMALVARAWLADGRLTGGAVVATVMSNLALERYLNDIGIGLVRTPVGDRYVVEQMRAGGYNVGGEQSGHIVLSDFATTGDGIIAALQVLAGVVQAKQPASQVTRLFEPLPQLLRNVRFNGGKPLEDGRVQAAIQAGETRLGATGRLVIRKSGTEPLIRVMAEGEDMALVNQVVGEICQTIERQAG